MISVFLPVRATTLAIVNVLPEPVTPRSVCVRPLPTPLARASIACGWSPVGLKSDRSLNLALRPCTAAQLWPII